MDTSRDDVAQFIRRWMRGVLVLSGWTAEEWARRAGLAPTTITRTLNDVNRVIIPNYANVLRLARAAHVPVPEGTERLVPVYEAKRLQGMGDISVDAADDMPGLPRLTQDQDAAIVLDRHMNGFQPSDVLYVQYREPGDRETVIVKANDELAAIGVYVNGWVVAADSQPFRPGNSHTMYPVIGFYRRLQHPG